MPTLVTKFPRVLFPVPFYIELMDTYKQGVRSDLINSIAQRIQDLEADQQSAARPANGSWAGLGHLVTVEEIDILIAKFFQGPKYGGNVGNVTVGQSRWELGTLEELFSEMRKPYDLAFFSVSAGVLAATRWTTNPDIEVQITSSFGSTEVSISAPSRATVQKYTDMFADAAPTFETPIPEPEPERPRIFIGHGGAPDWQETEQWLRRLGFEVNAYETLPHTGRTIERVLERALGWANFALLIMTAEDELADQSMQARQNVVHELGLFQGRLGWEQAIVMLEDGVTEFSNIAGTNQFRYPTGLISAKHGDIVVALRERFDNLAI